jgi:L-amino acid N-acyltransferase YncA
VNTARPEAAMRIIAMTSEHAPAVLEIYQAGIDEGQATFETAAPAWEVFDAAKLPEHRQVVAFGASECGPDVVGVFQFGP